MSYKPFITPNAEARDLNPEAHSGPGSVINSQNFLTLYDAYDRAPNELVEVFNRHQKKIGFRLMLKTFGFSRGVSNPTTGHYEYPWSEDLIQVGAIPGASTGPGSEVIISLASSSMFDTNITSGGAARKSSYGRKNEMIYFPNGMKAMIVDKDVTTDPHRLTLRPTKQSYDLANAITIGESYFISDNAYPEGSGLPVGVMPRIIKYNNTFQIVKESCGSTGSGLADKAYFNPVKGSPGSFFLKVKEVAYENFEDKTGGALLWGQSHDNLTAYVPSVDSDVPIEGTEGFIDFSTTNGYTSYYTPNSFGLQDFDTAAAYYEKQRASDRVICQWLGFDIYQEQENMLLELYKNNMDPFLSKKMLGFGGADPDDEKQFNKENNWTVSIGFMAVEKSAYRFGFKSMHEFNHVKQAGSANYDHSRWIISTPLGYTANKASGVEMPTLGYEYRALDGYSREVQMGVLAGIGVGGANGMPAPVHGNDSVEIGMLSHIGFHGACANKIYIQRPN